MILSLVVLALVLLIAYWWANQGVFSSILHFICVVCAGAMALALWEPITVNYLLSGGGFDDYAWGLSLGGMFVAFLLAFRLAADKLAPANLEFPQWANYTVGGAFGLLSGTLTLGITLIAAGFIQSTTELGGFVGYARSSDASGAPVTLQRMPVAQFTDRFYSLLSRGALSPMRSTSLAAYYPNLADVALSAHRDSWSDGAGKTSIAPAAVSISELAFDPGYRNMDGTEGAYAVRLSVDAAGFDGGEQFTLSAAQARLISDGATPGTAHPTQWMQPNDAGVKSKYAFDDLTNYATSIPGQQSVELSLIFPASGLEGRQPKFLQLKGLRLSLPTAQQLASAFEPAGAAGTSGDTAAKVMELVAKSQAPIVPSLVELKNSIMPAQLSANQVSGMEVLENNQGNWLVRGRGEYGMGGSGSISRSNRIRGFYFDKGTQIVMLDVSRGQSLPVDVFDGDMAKDQSAPISLVDQQGNEYRPAGYVWQKTDKVELFYDSTRLIDAIGRLPRLPSSGAHALKLVFKVPEGSVITAVKVGGEIAAKTNVVAVESQADG